MPKHVILWTFRSTLLPDAWRSWECLALTKAALIEKCLDRYGRAPSDCIPVEVVEFDVPQIGWSERGIVISQLMYSPHGVKYFENTFEEEQERIRLSNLKYAEKEKA